MSKSVCSRVPRCNHETAIVSVTGLYTLSFIREKCNSVFSHSNNLWKMDTFTLLHCYVYIRITLQATHKPLTHKHVTAECHSALETHELFTRTQAHTRIPMSNRCARPCEPWTWITSSGSTGRPQVKRDSNWTLKGRLGLKHTVRGDGLGTKPKGYNNGTVEMCKSSWKRSFGSVTKAQSLQERTAVREKPHTGMDTISGASMGLTDATN